jgi:alkane 1-monooxygenase
MQRRTIALQANRAEGGQRPLSFFLIYLVISFGLWLAAKGGLYTLLGPLAMTFVAVPLLDWVIGVDPRNASDSPPGWLSQTTFRIATWLAVPMQITVLLWGAATVTNPSASVIETLGATIAAGVSGGVIGINVAHELIHRPRRVDRALGKVLRWMACYGHWATEHVAGHHHRVATPGDPATARLGESLPAFLIRSVVGGFRSAWRIEARRKARRGVHSPLRNPVLMGLLVSCGIAALLGIVFGAHALSFFFAQSAIAIGFLETVNYVEHYGLERREVRPGVYERVTPVHSWNASERLTNLLLFNLQRHSDHHAWPARPYYKLRHHPEAPQLPTGYAGMALLAMVPPLWRRVMDPRVAAHRARVPSNSVES